MLGSLNPRVTDWRGRRVWLVGASSGIGAALAQAMIARGAVVALSARHIAVADPLLLGAASGSMAVPLDVTDRAGVEAACAQIIGRWGRIDLIVWLAGTYEPIEVRGFDLAAAERIVQTNLGGLINGLAALAPRLLDGQAGGIAIVASVAGYRGLPKSLIYGPTKAAQINLAESLFVELHARGTGVWLINPGFVSTPLTAANTFSMPALVSPASAAEAILAGFASGSFEIHFPRRFSWSMKLLALLPYWIYLRLAGRLVGH